MARQLEPEFRSALSKLMLAADSLIIASRNAGDKPLGQKLNLKERCDLWYRVYEANVDLGQALNYLMNSQTVPKALHSELTEIHNLINEYSATQNHFIRSLTISKSGLGPDKVSEVAKRLLRAIVQAERFAAVYTSDWE